MSDEIENVSRGWLFSKKELAMMEVALHDSVLRG
jgi:hypothetical protein